MWLGTGPRLFFTFGTPNPDDKLKTGTGVIIYYSRDVINGVQQRGKELCNDYKEPLSSLRQRGRVGGGVAF